MAEYYPAEFEKSEFNCPYCGVFAHQDFHSLIYKPWNYSNDTKPTELSTSSCSHCEQLAYWYKQSLIIPASGNVEMPNPDMPEDCKSDYLEARVLSICLLKEPLRFSVCAFRNSWST